MPCHTSSPMSGSSILSFELATSERGKKTTLTPKILFALCVFYWKRMSSRGTIDFIFVTVKVKKCLLWEKGHEISLFQIKLNYRTACEAFMSYHPANQTMRPLMNRLYRVGLLTVWHQTEEGAAACVPSPWNSFSHILRLFIGILSCVNELQGRRRRWQLW